MILVGRVEGESHDDCDHKTLTLTIVCTEDDSTSILRAMTDFLNGLFKDRDQTRDVVILQDKHGIAPIVEPLAAKKNEKPN